MRAAPVLLAAAVLGCASAPRQEASALPPAAVPADDAPPAAAEPPVDIAWEDPFSPPPQASVPPTEAEAPPAASPEVVAADPAAAALERARSLRAAGRNADADVELRALEKQAGELLPGQLMALRRLACEAAPPQSNAAACEAWWRACGGNNLIGCRAQVYQALSRTATPPLRARIEEARRADQCALAWVRAERPPECLAQAERYYRAHRDDVMLAWTTLLRARKPALAQAPAAALALLERIDGQCRLANCSELRASAAREAARLHRTRKDLEGEIKALLRVGRARSLALPSAQRLWARAPELDAVCDAWDAQKGPGACRKLEQRLEGAWTFTDFSRQKLGEGLPQERVRQVNQHYAPLLDRCLALEAERLPAGESYAYGLRWSVRNTGRVFNVGFDARFQSSPSLKSCLEAQFVQWRYPRYDGELQHVEQRFDVSARKRGGESDTLGAR